MISLLQRVRGRVSRMLRTDALEVQEHDTDQRKLHLQEPTLAAIVRSRRRNGDCPLNYNAMRPNRNTHAPSNTIETNSDAGLPGAHQETFRSAFLSVR